MLQSLEPRMFLGACNDASKLKPEAEDRGQSPTTVDYEHSVSLPKLLERAGGDTSGVNTRGLDFFGRLACMGLSRIREAAAFGGLPLDARRDSLRCGVTVVDCASGKVVATLFFRSGVDEIFDVRVLPSYRNPAISGPYPDIDDTETIWFVPGGTPGSSSPNS